MTFNDIANRIVEGLTKTYEEEFRGDLIIQAAAAYDPVNNHINHDREMKRLGYEKATEVVRQTLCKIISEEIKSKNLDFLL